MAADKADSWPNGDEIFAGRGLDGEAVKAELANFVLQTAKLIDLRRCP